MTVERMDHVGVVVEDLADAVAFFDELGLELEGEAQVDGDVVDRILGLQSVRTRIAMMRTPDGHRALELTEFHSPPAAAGDRHAPANALGIRHLTFVVDDIEATLARLQAHGAELVGEVCRYGDIYTLCYVRGPAGIIVELAEKIG